jgi:hypothetical protein
LEEYEKRKVILKAKFSSSITSGDKNRAWQEIVNIVNVGNSVKRDIKEIQKKWDNICGTFENYYNDACFSYFQTIWQLF